MTRRKAEKLPLPQTTEEAIGLIAAYAAADQTVEAIRSAADARCAAIRAEADIDTARHHAEIKSLLARLQPWWDIAAPALTGGTRKSLELAGCLIGHRLTPPKIDLGGLTESAAIGALVMAEMPGFVRVKRELDKPALLATLAAERTPGAAMLREIGFSTKQKQEFFIDRVVPKAPSVEVAVPVGEQVAA